MWGDGMNGSAIFLLFVIVTIVILVVIALRRNGERADIKADGSVEDDSAKTSMEAIQMQKGEGAVAETQITIYQHQEIRKVKLCPDCDGENGEASNVCEICGYKFN